MTVMIESLAEVSGRYAALFCDLWGCLHNGRAAYPAAVAALRAYRRAGGAVVLLTNAPRPSVFVEQQLARLGVPRDAWDLIVSSGDAAQDAMFAGAVGRRVWHLGPPKDDGFFTTIPDELKDRPAIIRVPLEDAEGIVCTGPFDEDRDVPEDYRARFLLAKARGLKLLCANPDLVVDYGERRIYCAGALAELYTKMGGESLYFGKPWPPIYDLARRRLTAHLGIDATDDRILAIGDGVGTDLQGAVAEGIDCLFITGGLEAAHFGPDPDRPDPSLVAAFLSQRQLSPTFAMGRLR